jgi:tRNA(Ile)-lysidine synthase
MLDLVRQTLLKHCGVSLEATVVVGVSGGPDSLCLLDMLHRLRIPLVVAHFNHRLRSEADAEAWQVQEFAETRGLPFVAGEGAVSEYAESQGLSVEEAARTLRYRFLFAEARRRSAQAVAVGHSADDQVETVLMHLLRGAGLPGLKGMLYRALPNAWSQTIPLVRPLLNIWRRDILRYLAEQNLEPLMDRTNLDVTIFRNRLRHELIPFLESFNPAIRQLVWRTAEVLSGDYEVLEMAIAEAMEACRIDQGSEYVALNIRELRESPVGLQRHIFRQAIARLRPGLRDIDFDSIERAVQFLHNPPTTRQQDLIAGLRLFQEGTRLWVAASEADLPGSNWPQLPDKGESKLDVPGEVIVPGGWRIRAEIVETVEMAQVLSNADPYQAWLDMDRLPGPLSVRARRPGDIFRPLGMHGHSMKLADFMINVKLPHRAREHWPLLVSADEVVWVPGYRLGNSYRIKERAGQVVRLSLVREDLSEEG